MKLEQISDKLGITLNAMQQASADAILNHHDDVVVLSPTGSGKTLAYLLPLSQLVNADSDDVQVMVVVPGRELALQTVTVLKDMGTGLRACACYGGRSTMDEHRILRRVKPQLICGTPGRLNDHLDKGNIDASHVRFVVIDEFDKCLEMGFHDEMQALMQKLPQRGVRRILLSATDADDLSLYVNHPVRIDYREATEQVPDRVTVYVVHAPVKDKLETLSQLLRKLQSQSSIVFLNYRDSVERTADYLRSEGFVVTAFHGGLDQKQREEALYKFSNGSANIMVSTDLGSRGLDIPNIQNIIHYHLPEQEENYIHRVGRTARWDKHGRTFFILNQEEAVPDYVDADIQDFDVSDAPSTVPEPRMATLYVGKGKKDKISKGDIVGFLCKKGGLKASEIGRIDVSDYYAYAAVDRKKFRQVLTQVKGEKIKGVRTVVEEIK